MFNLLAEFVKLIKVVRFGVSSCMSFPERLLFVFVGFNGKSNNCFGGDG